VSRYNPVNEAIRRRQAEGTCIFCGGPLTERKLLLAGKRKGEPEKVCLNEKCGRGRGRQVKIRG